MRITLSVSIKVISNAGVKLPIRGLETVTVYGVIVLKTVTAYNDCNSVRSMR